MFPDLEINFSWNLNLVDNLNLIIMHSTWNIDNVLEIFNKNILINFKIKYEEKIDASNLKGGSISFLRNFGEVTLILY
jgi:hypothetical protein